MAIVRPAIGATNGGRTGAGPRDTQPNPAQRARIDSTIRGSAPEAFHKSAPDILFEHLNESNGLANPVVTAFAEDGDGFLWVGSQIGLQRWDGYHFWSYKTVLGAADSLPDDLVQVLYTDWLGRLWVGTSSGGLARYDREQDRFVRYRAGPKDLNRVDIFSITGDGGRGLWVGSSTGLDHLDTDSGKFSHVTLAPIGGQEPRNASALLRAADGALWVGTERGLERSQEPGAVAPGRSNFQVVSLPTAKDATSEVQVLFRDSSGRIWVGTPHGAYVVERPNNPAKGPSQTGLVVRALMARGPGSEMLAAQRYLSIAETSAGEIWLGTGDEGIFGITENTPGNVVGSGAQPGTKVPWQVRRINHDPEVLTSLSDDSVQSMYLGKPGVMWVGTQLGMSYLDTTPKSVFTMLGGPGKNNAIGDTNVYSVLARPDGSVWLGVGRNGIAILDAAGERTAELRPGKTNPDTTLPYGPPGGLVEAGDGSVYIPTDRGLYRATPVGRQRPPRLQRLRLGEEASLKLTRVLPDEGKLWIGSALGLWVLDSVDGVNVARRPQMEGQLTDQRITVLQRGPGNALWIGTQNGLNRLDLTTNAVEPILPDPANPTALGGGYISSLLTDPEGRLWVGTFSGGIDVLEGRDATGNARFHRIIDGLPNENIDMMLQAQDGKIWASTDGGLAVIDPNDFTMQVLRHADGAVLPAYWNSSGSVTAHGDLLFGGIGGLTVVRPDMVKPWTYQPPVVVTNALIGNTEISTSRFNSGTEEYPVWIAPTDNNVTVGFAALDYTAPNLNRYEYKLVGFDRNWIPADATRRVARYTNLPPGDYMLLLRGSNRAGVWAPARQVRVRVLPAWFQTLWFKILSVVLTLLLLYAFILLATAYLRRQQHELERQVARRTAELQQMTVELKGSQQKLEHMAYTDALTNLPNRRMFTEHFKRLLALKRRQEGSFSLLLMDFDDFKEINDTYGHDAGDFVLVEMASRLSALVRESDCLARLGGDEFGLLLGQSHDVEGTEMVCQKIIEAFAGPVVFEGLELRTAPSIGIAIYPFDGEGQDKLYKAADLALYHAKRRGGNRCSWSDVAAAPAAIQ